MHTQPFREVNSKISPIKVLNAFVFRFSFEINRNYLHGGSPGDVGEVSVTYVKQRKGCRMSCDVRQVGEGLENEL